MMFMRLLIGCAGAAAVALAAWRLKMLTTNGSVAAAIIGTIIFGFGGWAMTVLLLLFFGSSSILTRLQAARKSHPEHRRGRSAGQVLANGAVATLVAIWYGVNPSPVAFLAFAGAIAAATADTWATEIGLLSPTPPRLITTRAIVPPGQSGGVTWLGSLSGVLGASVIGLSSGWWGASIIAVPIAGVGAMLIDSVLGATLEGRWSWMTNDIVNLISTASGAALAGVSSVWK